MPNKISLDICHMYSVQISAQVDFVMVRLTAAKHNAKSMILKAIQNRQQGRLSVKLEARWLTWF
jgi:hypothetical protein